MKVLSTIKPRDIEKEQSEKERTLNDFLNSYNESIPAGFPQVSSSDLTVFKNTHASLFEASKNTWTLDRHRKKVMDWLPQHTKSLS